MKKTIKDKDIREPLCEYLEERFGKCRIFEEKRMGKSRADMVMVLETEVWGIEIKSDADTYTRLSRQVKDYDAFFDRNVIVVGSSHGQHVAEHVPEDWGIITVEETEDGLDFYEMREAKVNPKRNLAFKLSILWRPELAPIQERHAMHAYARQSKKFVQDKILTLVPEEELHREISEELFERDYEKIAEQIDAYRLEHGQRKKRRTVRNKRKYKAPK